MHSIDIQTDSTELALHKCENDRQTMVEKEDVISKSSTDSNQLRSESETISSTTNELDSSYRSLESHDSTTIVSEINNSLIEDKRPLIDEKSDNLEASAVTKRPLVIDPNRVANNSHTSFTSPESDNYSFAHDIKVCMWG